MNNPLILVVEDDPPVRNLITTPLNEKAKDYRYPAAKAGEAALLETAALNPDTVLRIWTAGQQPT